MNRRGPNTEGRVEVFLLSEIVSDQRGLSETTAAEPPVSEQSGHTAGTAQGASEKSGHTAAAAH